MKAFFLDRDGTLILDKHCLADPAGVELIPGVPEALARFYTLDDAIRCNARMEELIELPPPVFDDICISP